MPPPTTSLPLQPYLPSGQGWGLQLPPLSLCKHVQGGAVNMGPWVWHANPFSRMANRLLSPDTPPGCPGPPSGQPSRRAWSRRWGNWASPEAPCCLLCFPLGLPDASVPQPLSLLATSVLVSPEGLGAHWCLGPGCPPPESDGAADQVAGPRSLPVMGKQEGFISDKLPARPKPSHNLRASPNQCYPASCLGFEHPVGFRK